MTELTMCDCMTPSIITCTGICSSSRPMYQCSA